VTIELSFESRTGRWPASEFTLHRDRSNRAAAWGEPNVVFEK